MKGAFRSLVRRWGGPFLRARRAGEGTLAWNSPEAARLPATLALRSPNFAHDGAMPLLCAGPGVGGNRSPQLTWGPLPPQASHWLLLCEDPDVPLARPILHLLASGPAAVTGLAAGALAEAAVPPGVTLGFNGLGLRGYAGPRPMPGHGPHRYVFQLFALRGAPASLLAVTELPALLRKCGLARGRLDGLFERDWRARPIAPRASLLTTTT